MKIYVYEHCPYCVKARMIFGFKDIPHEVIMLANDDEETPISMVGKKLVPILQKEDGSYMGESMDIVAYIDETYGETFLSDAAKPKMQAWTDAAWDTAHGLLLALNGMAPFPEFETTSARAYYTKKKEGYVGAFAEHFASREHTQAALNAHLPALEAALQEEGEAKLGIGEEDIHLFALLRGLSLIKGLHYPTTVRAYMEDMASRTNMELYDAIAG